MNSDNKIGYIEAICIVVIVTITSVLLNEPKIILKNTGSAAIINVIYITILAFLLAYLIYALFKNFKNSDILDIGEYLAGKKLKVLLGIIFIGLILFYASIILRNIGENLKIIYFQNANISYLLLLFVLPVAIVNFLGFKSVIKCNLIMVPIILIAITIIFIFTAPDFTYQRMFPILGNGLGSIFLQGSSSLVLFTGVAYLYFLMPYLKEKKDFKKISLISVGICAYSAIISVISLLFIFPFVIPGNESVPIYLATREISFGSFIERTDILFILIWILTIFTNLSVAIAFVVQIFKKITNISDSKSVVFCFSSILFAISLIYNDLLQLDFAENTVFLYAFFALGLVFSLGVLIFANIKHKRQNKNIAKKEGVV